MHELQPFLAYFLLLVGIIPLVFQICQLSFLVELCLLELSLVLNGSLFQVLNALLQLSLINVNLLTACNSQVSGCFVDDLETHLGEYLRRSRILWSVRLELLLEYINFLQDHIHRLVEVFVELLSDGLHFRLEEFANFTFTEFLELGF